MNWHDTIHTAIDSWTAIHFLVWALAAVIAVQWSRIRIVNIIRLAVVCGIGWEVVETFAEPLWGGHETWANRWLFDIAADIAGTIFGLMATNTNTTNVDIDRL